MEVNELLAATGVLGLLAALLLATVFLLVQPLWAIIDCAESDRETDTKVLVWVALLFTWGFGGVLYGIFMAKSAALRTFTLGMLGLTMLLGMAGFSTCAVGSFRASEQAQVEAEVARKEAAVAIRTFQPATLPADTIAPFPALLVVGPQTSRSAAVADFTLAGPELSSARDVGERIRHVAVGAGGLFAITQHDFGAISPTTGRLIEIALDPTLEQGFSWPKGLTFDAREQKIVVLTNHVGTRFYRYDPRSAAWERLAAEPSTPELRALAWLPETDLLYSIEVSRRATQLERLQRFNRDGASLGALAIVPPIPLDPDVDDGFQLHTSSGQLVLIVPPGKTGSVGASEGATRIFAIDPESGQVRAAAPPETERAQTPASGDAGAA